MAGKPLLVLSALKQVHVSLPLVSYHLSACETTNRNNHFSCEIYVGFFAETGWCTIIVLMREEGQQEDEQFVASQTLGG
jgi:hypothetical protein